MIDDETILLLNAHVDGELSPSETLAMEKRLAAEPALRAYADELRGISRRTRAVLDVDSAPEALRGKIVGAIGLSDDAPVRNTRPVAWMAMAASLLVGVALGALVTGTLSPWAGSKGPDVSDMVFASHLRGLAAPQPFDIASSDRHVVKPWFNGRTTIAPMTPDLAKDGFPLVGGRVDVVEDEKVPTLVYNRRRHVISVTVIASSPDMRDGEELRDGSTLESWAVGNLTYVAVSDLNVTELRQFVELFKAAAR